MSRESSDSSKVNQPLKQAIEALLTDRPVAYHPLLTRAVGSATAGIFLSQLLYWTPRSQHSEGWVYKVQQDILDETGLTRTEQETARRLLRSTRVLEEMRAGVPAKLYFRVNMDRLIELMASLESTPGKRRRPNEAVQLAAQDNSDAADKDAGTPQTRMQEPRKLESANPANKNAAFPQTITEITTEITTENVVVVRALEDFGISGAVAQRLVAGRSEEYLRAKLNCVQWLVDTGSRLVGKNPAGYLRRAIEEDYQPPPDYVTPAERQAKAEAKAHAEREAQEQEHQRAAELAAERELTHQQLMEHFPPAPIPGTTLTTYDIWQQVLDHLDGTLTAPNIQMFLKPVVLARCADDAALVVAPSRWHAEHLRSRLRPYVEQTLTTILSRPTRCDCVAFADVLQDTAGHQSPASTGEAMPAVSPNGTTAGSAALRRRGRPPKNRPSDTAATWAARQNGP